MQRLESYHRITLFLCIAFGFISLIQGLELNGFQTSQLAFPCDLFSLKSQPFSLLTYALVHLDFGHFISNAVVLFFFGFQLHQIESHAPVWRLFLFGCLGGAFTFLLLSPFHSSNYLAGSSAGVMAIAAYAVTKSPRKLVSLFGTLNIELLWIFVGILLVDFLAIREGEHLSGHLAHLGGAICGYLYAFTNRISFTRMSLIQWIRRLFGQSSSNGNPHRRPKTDDEFNAERKEKQLRTDAILDKINRSGYNSLTADEKDFLAQQSHR
jgi:membrane associated rhomboid family serine protease